MDVKVFGVYSGANFAKGERKMYIPIIMGEGLTIGEEPGEGQAYLALPCRTHGTVLITVSVLDDEDFAKQYHCPECGAILEGWDLEGNPS